MTETVYEGIELSPNKKGFDDFERLIRDNTEDVIIFNGLDLHNPYVTGRLLTIMEKPLEFKTVIVKPKVLVYNALVSRAGKIILNDNDLNKEMEQLALENINNYEAVKVIADIMLNSATTNVSVNMTKEVLRSELHRVKERT